MSGEDASRSNNNNGVVGRSSRKDFYAILGVPKDATTEQVKQAFKVKARALHPDKNLDNPNAKEEFQVVSEAYNVLKDHEKRRLYDLGVADDQISELAEPNAVSEFLKKVFGIRMVDPHDENDKLQLTALNKLMLTLCCCTLCCWLPPVLCLCGCFLCFVRCCCRGIVMEPPNGDDQDFDNMESAANNAGGSGGEEHREPGNAQTANVNDISGVSDEKWTYERLDSLPVSVLKAILEGRNVEYTNCVEKSDLVRCALKALNPQAAAEAEV